LGSGRFAAKTPNYERWISLDLLGFSRPDRDLSMSYEDFSREKNSRALFRDKATEKPPRPLGIQNAKITHPPSLASFLILRNQLLSDPLPFRPPHPKATA
jgi:hypothetical protein